MCATFFQLVIKRSQLSSLLSHPPQGLVSVSLAVSFSIWGVGLFAIIPHPTPSFFAGKKHVSCRTMSGVSVMAALFLCALLFATIFNSSKIFLIFKFY